MFKRGPRTGTGAVEGRCLAGYNIFIPCPVPGLFTISPHPSLAGVVAWSHFILVAVLARWLKMLRLLLPTVLSIQGLLRPSPAM